MRSSCQAFEMMRSQRSWLMAMCISLSLSTMPQSSFAADPSPRPNILLIMADDMGFSDIGCYGGEIKTPHLDSLAAAGLRFTQFYNTARCCPTRASLLTGLYPHQAGVGHMVGDDKVEGYRGRLNDECVTIAEVLKPHGYRTYMTGKWHIGEQRPHWPVDRGFDRSYSLVSGGTNFFRLDPGRTLVLDDQRIDPPKVWYVTDAIGDHSVSFLDEHAKQSKDKPFFMYVAYTAPHWPLHAHPQDIAKYRNKYTGGWDALRQERHQRMIEMGIVDKQWPMTPRPDNVRPWLEAEDKDDKDLRMAVYAAQIDRMDQSIGRILAKLREQNQLENTLIFFLSDNGGCAEIIDRGTKGVPAGAADSFLSYGVGWANASNTPFRLYKHWVHEGGIATPLIAHWPAGIKRKNELDHQPGHLIDIMATVVDVTGAIYPKEINGKAIQPREGVSLRPAFEGKSLDRKTSLYWEHEGNQAIRDGRWKLVKQHNKPWELYDLSADRTEMNDLAKQQPERVKAMSEEWDAYAKRARVTPWAELQKLRNAGNPNKGKNKDAKSK